MAEQPGSCTRCRSKSNEEHHFLTFAGEICHAGSQREVRVMANVTRNSNGKTAWVNKFLLVLLLLACQVFCVAAAAPPPSELIKVEVIGVQDGDTFDAYIISIPPSLKDTLSKKINLDQAPFVRVRLLGIDAPEIDHPYIPCECWGDEASDSLARLLPEGSTAYLEVDERTFDKYDRLLAYVWLSPHRNLMVNAVLVSTGNAVVLSLSPDLRYEEVFAALESAARDESVGLWQSCVYPWSEAQDHADERAVFIGGISGTHFDEESGTTFINIGNDYPIPNRLTLVIRAASRDYFIWFFGAPPEIFFDNADIAAYGRVELEGETPEIKLWTPSHIWIQQSTDANVEIWEVEVNPAGRDAGHEWLKLRNLTDKDISIGGWLLLTRTKNLAAVRIPEGATIAAQDYYLVEDIPFQWLDNKDEMIELRDRTGNLVDMTPPGVLDDNDDDARIWYRNGPTK